MDTQPETHTDSTGVLEPSIQPIGFTRSYAANWSSYDAFKEFYQNWKDSILQVHGISLLGFCPHVTETDEAIIVSVPKTNNGHASLKYEELAGYIRFKKSDGNVELTNFNAKLDTRCLEIGYTTKNNDDRLSGVYGKGLKVAALALCREDFNVKICSNNCYWNFGFRGKLNHNLYCQVTPASKGKIKRLMARLEKDLQCRISQQLTAKIWKDVSVFITKGGKHNSCNESRLTRDIFWSWMRATIDVNPPAPLIRTLKGDLILDEKFAGHLYFKGIEFSLGDNNGSGLHVGYNLATENPDRSLGRLIEPEKRSKLIAEIWESAIRRGNESALLVYIDFLRHHPTRMDVQNAEDLVTENVARIIWAKLKEDSQKTAGFFHHENSGCKSLEIITKDLKLQPQTLSLVLWRILRKHNLILTPDEELQRRLEEFEVIQIPGTRFAQEFDRALRALLVATSITRNVSVLYVRAGDEETDIAFAKNKKTLYIHERWLYTQRAHLDSDCPVRMSPQIESDSFFCEHIVHEIYHRAVALINPSVEWTIYGESKPNKSLYLSPQMVQQKLHDMPRHVRVVENEDTAIQVLWEDGHSHAFSRLYGSSVEYIAILHSVDCLSEVQRLLFYEDAIVCACPRQRVPQRQRSAIFSSTAQQTYLPMVARYKKDAIFGLPPLHNSHLSSPIIATGVVVKFSDDEALGETMKCNKTSLFGSELPKLIDLYDSPKSPNSVEIEVGVGQVEQTTPHLSILENQQPLATVVSMNSILSAQYLESCKTPESNSDLAESAVTPLLEEKSRIVGEDTKVVDPDYPSAEVKHEIIRSITKRTQNSLDLGTDQSRQSKKVKGPLGTEDGI